jgi:hypothetical protein
MQRRMKPTSPLEDRLEQMAEHCRQRAAHLPPGPERDELIRKARQAETHTSLSGYCHPDSGHQHEAASIVRPTLI